MRTRELTVIIVGLLICSVCQGQEDQGLFISGRVLDDQAQAVAQAEILPGKDVKVHLVQVAEMDQATLDQWLAKYKIPFKCPFLNGDFEEKKLEWA